MQKQKFKDFSYCDVHADFSLFLEKRLEVDGSGNPLYIGYSRVPNAASDEDLWYIVKLYYDGSGYLIRSQLPDDGPQFKYAWDDRATLFS